MAYDIIEMTAERLIEAARSVRTPFRLMVRVEGVERELVFRRILRLLPGKRIVAVAECDGRELLIKTFLGRSAGRYAAREREGVEAISLAGVRTPDVFWSGSALGGHGRVLAFEYLEDATDLATMWEQAAGDGDRLDILTRAVIVIAHMHAAGVVQRDIHLRNFLLSGGSLFTIDGGDVDASPHPGPLSESASLANLALFFAQFHHETDESITIVLPAYEAVREWRRSGRRTVALKDHVREQRDRRKRAFIDKAFRECTRFVCQSSLRSYAVCERSRYSEAMQQLLADPDAAIAQGEVLKAGNSSTVAVVDVDGLPVVIKRYNIKGIWHGLRGMARKSRAWRCWMNAIRLEFFGIPALRPVALLERRFGPLRFTTYFITEYVEGPDICEFLKGREVNGEIEKMVRILTDLREAKISHGDMKGTNIIVSPKGPVVIDLDAMREHDSETGFSRAFRKDVNRLLRNWAEEPEVRQQVGQLLEERGLT
ncbi:MAG: hypothetical protein CMD83_16870 [Gammaproteobacteria bacterium]|nr:hypothetical protein [Gammaproteobacteria bacterium]